MRRCRCVGMSAWVGVRGCGCGGVGAELAMYSLTGQDNCRVLCRYHRAHRHAHAGRRVVLVEFVQAHGRARHVLPAVVLGALRRHHQVFPARPRGTARGVLGTMAGWRMCLCTLWNTDMVCGCVVVRGCVVVCGCATVANAHACALRRR